MNTIDLERPVGRKSDVTSDKIRENLLEYSKTFKTSWVNLGQSLYPVWKDKMFYSWGFDKFEYYVERELGIQKPTALKLLKTYFFVEQQEPEYLSGDFSQTREAAKVPDYDAVNVLRLARQKKELKADDYRQLREAVFEKGKGAPLARKDLTAIMKERKQVDPEEERQKRSVTSIKQFATAIRLFSREMETLKLVSPDLVEEAKGLLQKLEKEVDEAK